MNLFLPSSSFPKPPTCQTIAEASTGPEASEQPLCFPFLHMSFHQGNMASESKILWWMCGTESICPVHESSRMALAWFAEQEAEHLERLLDDEVTARSTPCWTPSSLRRLHRRARASVGVILRTMSVRQLPRGHPQP
jgi:hypothetical protein